MAGYDADTGKLVAKALGVEPCFVTPTWTEIISGHWNDRWDISYGSGAINSDRMERLYFTQPYRAEPQRFFVRKSSQYKKPSDLDGKTIGVCDSCTVEFYLKGDADDPRRRRRCDVKNAKIVGLRVGAARAEGGLDRERSTPTSAPRRSAWRRSTRARLLRPLPGDAFTMYLTGFVDKSSSLRPAGVRRAGRPDRAQAAADGRAEGALDEVFFGKDYATNAADYNIAQLHQKIPTTATG